MWSFDDKKRRSLLGPFIMNSVTRFGDLETLHLSFMATFQLKQENF